MSTDPDEPFKSNPLAERLGLLADVAKLGDRMHDASFFYELTLESCEKLFDNELDQNAFEEQLRYMFGIHVSAARVVWVGCLADVRGSMRISCLRSTRLLARLSSRYVHVSACLFVRSHRCFLGANPLDRCEEPRPLRPAPAGAQPSQSHNAGPHQSAQEYGEGTRS